MARFAGRRGPGRSRAAGAPRRSGDLLVTAPRRSRSRSRSRASASGRWRAGRAPEWERTSPRSGARAPPPSPSSDASRSRRRFTGSSIPAPVDGRSDEGASFPQTACRPSTASPGRGSSALVRRQGLFRRCAPRRVRLSQIDGARPAVSAPAAGGFAARRDGFGGRMPLDTERRESGRARRNEGGSRAGLSRRHLGLDLPGPAAAAPTLAFATGPGRLRRRRPLREDRRLRPGGSAQRLAVAPSSRFRQRLRGPRSARRAPARRSPAFVPPITIDQPRSSMRNSQPVKAA